MVTLKTKLKNLYKNSPLEIYSKYFYYGFEGKEWTEEPIGSFCKGLWCNEETVKSLNHFKKYYKKGKVKTIYLDPKKPDVNLILLTHEKTSKFVLLAAGGGYASVATAIETLAIGDYLYQKGFCVGYLTYSIGKAAYLDGPINDMNKAVSYVNKNKERLNIDIENYIAIGCSAGANLIARLGTDNKGYKTFNLPKPGLLGLAYPVITMGKYTHLQSRNFVIGENPSNELIDEYSIEKHVSSIYPPTFIWQSERDNIVPFKNSLMMVEALKKANVKYIFKSYDSDQHGWGIAVNRPAEGWVDELLEFYNGLYL